MAPDISEEFCAKPNFYEEKQTYDTISHNLEKYECSTPIAILTIRRADYQ
jgi:hypothetical protein